jgi:hypothetical protein
MAYDFDRAARGIDLNPARVSKTTLFAAVCVSAVVWLSLGILALTDGDGADRVGVLPPAWLLGILMVVAIAAAAVARPSWCGGLPLLLLLVLVLPWVPLPVPALFLIFTGPAVVLMWGAAALCMLAVVADRTIRKRGHASLCDARRAPRVAALLAFVIFLVVRLGRPGPPIGDEPTTW